MEAAEALGQAGDPRLRENNWVRIPAGTFVMGEDEEAHEVELDAYEIGKVSGDGGGVRAFRRGGRAASRGSGTSSILYPNRPVVNVSWHDAEAYCRWAGVPAADGGGVGAAARGQEGRQYPWGNEEPDATRANY